MSYLGSILPTWETEDLLCYPINKEEQMLCSFQSLAPPQGWNVLRQRKENWKFAFRFPGEKRLWEQLEEHSLCPPGFPSVAQKCLFAAVN